MSKKNTWFQHKTFLTGVGLLTVTALIALTVTSFKAKSPDKIGLAAPTFGQSSQNTQLKISSEVLNSINPSSESLSSLSTLSSLVTDRTVNMRPKTVDEIKADRIIVKFKENTNQSQKNQIINQAGKVSDHIKDEKLKLPGEVIIQVNNSNQQEALLTALAKNPNVEYAELDSKQDVEQTTTDPAIQWHHDNISAKTAWTTTTGQRVLVAVCDTGIQKDHPDLQANLRADLGYNIYTGTATGWDSLEHPHGTMVAGTIANTANTIGGRGVAFDAQIVPLKVTFDASGSTYLSYLSSCIKYAADQNIKVINVSFTGAGSLSIDNAARYASSKGSTVIFAAGNSGSNLRFTNYNSVVTVSATNENNQKASFSDYGKFVDLSAPGTNIVTSNWNSGYAKVNGTSFAAPIVAANVALALSIKPTLTPAQVLTLLTTSIDDLGPKGYDLQFGHGKINAAKMVTKTKALP